MCGAPKEQCLGGNDYGPFRRKIEQKPEDIDEYISDCISKDWGADEKEIYFMKYGIQHD